MKRRIRPGHVNERQWLFKTTMTATRVELKGTRIATWHGGPTYAFNFVRAPSKYLTIDNRDGYEFGALP